MSADHLIFLKDKFVRDLEEAMEEFGDELLPLCLHFEEVKTVVQEWRISPSTSIKMKDPLYDLRYVLADCKIFAEKERDYKRENKKSSSLFFINGHYVKKCFFFFLTRRKLLRITTKLLQGMNYIDAAVESGLESFQDSVLVTAYIAGCPALPRPRLGDLTRLDASKIRGFDDYFQKIKALLLETPTDDDGRRIKAIGIVGMAGSGKTTLARILFHSPDVQKSFSCLIWVQLTGKFHPENADSRKALVGKVLRRTSGQYFDKSIKQLLQDLYKDLVHEKYLIVLDNVWHESDWYYELDYSNKCTTNDDDDDGTGTGGNFTRLTHGLPKGSRGAIIVISRFEGVASRMVGGEHNLYRIRPSLDADECWSIFMDTINEKNFVKNSVEYPTLLKMNGEIGDQCDGLPLAAKILAEVISIQIGKEGYWSDRKVKKDIVLRLDVHNKKSMRMANEIILSFPGVLYVDSALDKEFIWEPKELWIEGKSSGDGFGNTFRVVGAYDLLNLVRELENSWYTELISVERERA